MLVMVTLAVISAAFPAQGFSFFDSNMDLFNPRMFGRRPSAPVQCIRYAPLENTRFNLEQTRDAAGAAGYEVAAHMPSVRREDIDLRNHDGVLTIEALRRANPACDPYWRSRSADSVTRSFRLSPEVDSNRISASFDDDVLRVWLPLARAQAKEDERHVPRSQRQAQYQAPAGRSQRRQPSAPPTGDERGQRGTDTRAMPPTPPSASSDGASATSQSSPRSSSHDACSAGGVCDRTSRRETAEFQQYGAGDQRHTKSDQHQKHQQQQAQWGQQHNAAVSLPQLQELFMHANALLDATRSDGGQGVVSDQLASFVSSLRSKSKPRPVPEATSTKETQGDRNSGRPLTPRRKSKTADGTTDAFGEPLFYHIPVAMPHEGVARMRAAAKEAAEMKAAEIVQL